MEVRMHYYHFSPTVRAFCRLHMTLRFYKKVLVSQYSPIKDKPQHPYTTPNSTDSENDPAINLPRKYHVHTTWIHHFSAGIRQGMGNAPGMSSIITPMITLQIPAHEGPGKLYGVLRSEINFYLANLRLLSQRRTCMVESRNKYISVY